MGTTINGVYIPSANETGWSVPMNAGLTTLANAHITAQSIFLPVDAGGTAATRATVGGGTTSSTVDVFPNSVTSTSWWMFQIPADATTAALVVRPVWAAATTDGTAHTVRWSMESKDVSAGGDITSAGTPTPFTGLSGSRTIGIVVLETGASTPSFTAGHFIRLNISRLGADGADTFVNSVYLLGVRIDYVAV